jgi:ferredoxin-NADP reductase
MSAEPLVMAEPTQRATVLSVTDLTANVRQLVVRPTGQHLYFQPGQWVSLKLPVGLQPPLNRAYSMAAPLSPSGELTFIFDRVPEGMGSGYLYHLKAGDELMLSGPYGRFLMPDSSDRELLLIGRYTGLVPLRCMLKARYTHRNLSPVLLIAVAPGENEVLFHNELLSLAMSQPSFRYLPLVATAEEAAVSITLTMLRPLIDGKPHVLPMLCGTKGFVRPLKSFFMEAGYDRKEIKTETYD